MFLLVILSMTFIYETIKSFQTGIGGHTRKNGTEGCICHMADSTSSVIVRITGPSEVAPNSINTYRITMRGGYQVAGGFDFNVKYGSVDTVPGEQTIRFYEIPNPGDTTNDISHSAPKNFSGDSVSWLVKYIAPNTTTLVRDTLFATGNSVNLNGIPDDSDKWNFSPNLIIQVNPSIGIQKISSVAEGFSLSQNYPNPFNPITKIRFSVPAGYQNNAKLVIYDTRGMEIDVLVDAKLSEGTYEYSWDAWQYASGVYYYKLVSGKYSEVKKMILVK